MPLTRKSKWQKHPRPTKEKEMHEKRRQSWASLFGQSDNHKAEKKKLEHKKTMTVRDTVKKRDHNRCQFPGCEEKATALHHIIFKSQGGKNEESNMVSLCDLHHTLGNECPHCSDEWRRYWERWSKQRYPEYWEVRERA